MTNPLLEGGLFTIILILAFFFTLYAFKIQNGKGMLRMIGMALFCVLAIFVGSGYEVAFTTKGGQELTYNINGTLLTNKTTSNVENVILPGGEDSAWMSWLFTGFAMANIMFLLKDYQGGT